jgi:hypothetical protein
MDRLTPRERAIYSAFVAYADKIGIEPLEAAAILFARLEHGASSGMLRLDPADNPRPMIGAWGE